MQYLRPVIGNSQWCGPCALSAVTGRPSDTWADVRMSLASIDTAAVSAGGVRLPDGWPIRFPLGVFGDVHRRMDGQPSAWPLYPSGAWLVDTYQTDRQRIAAKRRGYPDARGGHLIAVGVDQAGGRRLQRCFAENGQRLPKAFSRMRSALRWRYVSAAWQFNGDRGSESNP